MWGECMDWYQMHHDMVKRDGFYSARRVGYENGGVSAPHRYGLSREEIDVCLNCTKKDCTGNCAAYQAVAHQYGRKRKRHD